MRITYDSNADALYIRLLEGEYECEVLRINEDVALEIGPGQALVGIEVVNARSVLGEGRHPAVVLENLPRFTL